MCPAPGHTVSLLWVQIVIKNVDEDAGKKDVKKTSPQQKKPEGQRGKQAAPA